MINPEIQTGFNSSDYLNKLIIQLEETMRVCIGGVETSLREANDKESNAVNVALSLNKNQMQNLNALSSQLKNTAEEILNVQKDDFDYYKSEIIRTAEEIKTDYQKEISETATSLETRFGESYVAKTELEEYKSAVNTTFEQNTESIRLNAENTESIQTELAEYKKNNNADLAVQAENIVAQVESTFASKTELENVEEHLISKITQESGAITEEYVKQVKVVSDKVSENEEVVSAFIEDLNVYIRRGELAEGVYGIEIGRSDSGIVSRFTNDRLSFMQSGVEIAYVSGSNLYITRAEILDYLKIGKATEGYFTFDVTENGLEVRWNG